MIDFLPQFELLRARNRVGVFARAIRRVVRPGDVVLDVGAGTGILGFLALKAGARHVVAVERSPAILIAQEIARRNGLADRMTFVFGRAEEARARERADVVVHDILGHGGVDRATYEILRAAVARLAKPGARMVPWRVLPRVTPVESPRLHRRFTGWSRFQGLDLTPFGDVLRHRGFMLFEPPGARLAPACLLGGFDLRSRRALRFPAERAGTCAVARSGTLHGLLWEYDCELAAGVFLGTRPGHGRPPFFFPVTPPLEVRRGDRVRMRILIGDDRSWSWEVRAGREIRRAAGALAAPATLLQAHLREGWVPRPGEDRRRQARVIAAMDGRSLSELASWWSRETRIPLSQALAEIRRVCAERNVAGDLRS